VAPLVVQFQQDLISGTKSVSDLLRTAKLIAAKLNLGKLEAWIHNELHGYPEGSQIPDYRRITGVLHVQHPNYGWQQVGRLAPQTLVFSEAIASAEALRDSGGAYPVAENYPLTSDSGNSMGSNWPQQFHMDPTRFKTMLDAVRTNLLEWAIELEKNGITGQNMNFNEEEKKAAAQVFNFHGPVHGPVGTVTGTTNVNVYNYSQELNQSLTQSGVPEDARQELKALIEKLNTATGEERKSVLERGAEWMDKWGPLAGAVGVILQKIFE
jgi:hypothetical protein